MIYSSAKLGLESFKRRVTALRASLLTARLLEPLWRRLIVLETLAGRLRANNLETAFAVTFLWPTWAALDPYKEAVADVTLLNAGLRSRAEIISARGRDPEEVFAEITGDGFRPAQSPNLSLVKESDNAA